MAFKIVKLIKDHTLYPGCTKPKGTVLKVDIIKYRELLSGGFIRGTVSDKVKKLLNKKQG